MRILYSHRIRSHDGQGVHVDEMVAALRAAGHEVCVVGPSAYAKADLGDSSAFVDRLRARLPRAFGELAEIGYNLLAIPRLVRAWRSFQPDLVYERYNLFHLAGAWLARRRGVLLYLEVNAPLADERARHGGLGMPSLARAIERYTWCSGRRVLAVTQVLADMIVSGGVDPKAVSVIPNAIVPARFATHTVTHSDNGAPVSVGFVGFVRKWHGLDSVLDAMAADPLPLTLTVVGEGPVRTELEEQAARLGLQERVKFLGLVAHDRIPEVVAGFAIALQPQATEYASPLKIFEYMAAGCTIVAPDQPNIREILTHEETALLFDPARSGAMWEAVRRLASDPALCARLGMAARQIALTRHSWAGNAAQVTDLVMTDQCITHTGQRPAVNIVPV